VDLASPVSSVISVETPSRSFSAKDPQLRWEMVGVSVAPSCKKMSGTAELLTGDAPSDRAIWTGTREESVAFASRPRRRPPPSWVLVQMVQSEGASPRRSSVILLVSRQLGEIDASFAHVSLAAGVKRSYFSRPTRMSPGRAVDIVVPTAKTWKLPSSRPSA
jgi:hypothetical protein